MTEDEKALFLLTHTEEKTYYESGKLRSHYWYKDGKMDGESKIYFESGELVAHTWWKDGEIFTELTILELKKEYGIND